MNLSDEIKTIRKKAFLSQMHFAEEIKVSFSTVNRWENGKGKPNLTAMKEIKAFCERNSISYAELEDAWINSPSK